MELEQLKKLKTGDVVFVKEPLSPTFMIKPHTWKKAYLKHVNAEERTIILSVSGSGFVQKFDEIVPFDKWNFGVYQNQQLEDLKNYSTSVYNELDKWKKRLPTSKRQGLQ